MSIILELPKDERPREKLLIYGASRLTDAELLAIFLRTGVKGKSAITLAQELIDNFGSLPALLTASHSEFCQHLGLGDAKYAQLQAVLEMAKRHYLAEAKMGERVTSTSIAVRLLRKQIQDETRESICGLFLDSKHRVIAAEVLAVGSLREAPIYPRELVRRALAHNAAALILAHNHPSGDPTPSEADISITKQLKTTLQPLDVRLLDHIIIGKGFSYLSLLEAGLVE
jgi:DNA repair protein RadC